MRAVHEGWSAVSASRATHARICSSRLDARPGRRLAALVGRERGLAEDPPGDPDRLHPLPPILVGRQVVEPDRRVDARVGRGDPHGPPRVGAHRPDVDLVAVVPPPARAVVADRQRQEVEHQVGVGDVVVAAREAAPSKWFVAPGPRRRNSHWKPIHGRRHVAERGLHRHRLGARCWT